MNGVVDVRLQELVVVPAIIAPSLRSGENHDTTWPTVVAVLSVAAGIVVAAIAFRKFMRRSGAVDKYETSNPDNDSFGDRKILEESLEQQY
jgi:membrane protein implicated in regulation of membrane protease activity